MAKSKGKSHETKEERRERHRKKTAKSTCLNCGHKIKVDDKYCPNCGQQNIDRRVPLVELLGEFGRDYITFDSKLFRTLRPLIIKPGFLTNAFNSGQRVNYMPPIRMYLFISFLFFFLIAMLPSDLPTENPGAISFSNGDDLRVSGNFSPEEQQELDVQVSGMLQDKMDRIQAMSPNEFRLMVHRTMSVMMFFIMPLFALILSLFYINKKRFYVEHMVFSLHLHSAFFLLEFMLAIAVYFSPEFPAFEARLILNALYLFFALQAVYGDGIGITIAKQFGIVVTYSILIGISVLLAMFVRLAMV